MSKNSIILVGGGLAGITLAIKLAQRNIGVILLEKNSYPFHRVCGEYIAMESWDYILSCGLPLQDLALPRLQKLEISAPNGNMLKHSLKPGGFGISRFKLDALLVAAAREAGVEVIENCKVENIAFDAGKFLVTTSLQNFETDLVVGSYGKRSNIDIKLKRNFIQRPAPIAQNYVGVKYHIKTDLAHDVIQLHNFEDGYCGVSKIEDDRYCLCYLTTAQNLQKHTSIGHMEKEILFKNPYLKKYFTESEFLYDVPLSISQVNFANKSVVENHILMCGDSAGMITPLCGNGMSIALHSSKILSDLIGLYRSNQLSRIDLEQAYTYHWKAKFSTRIKVGRLIQHTFGKSFMTNAVINSLKPFPKIVGGLVSLTHGDTF